MLAGVYVGCMYQEYTGLLADAGMKLSAATATGNSLAFMVGRVSYTFGLAGAQLVESKCMCRCGSPTPKRSQGRLLPCG